jgi:hypothetical protein
MNTSKGASAAPFGPDWSSPRRARAAGNSAAARLEMRPGHGCAGEAGARIGDEFAGRADQKRVDATRTAASTHGRGQTPISTTPAVQIRIDSPRAGATVMRPGRAGASMYIRFATSR